MSLIKHINVTMLPIMHIPPLVILPALVPDRVAVCAVTVSQYIRHHNIKSINMYLDFSVDALGEIGGSARVIEALDGHRAVVDDVIGTEDGALASNAYSSGVRLAGKERGKEGKKRDMNGTDKRGKKRMRAPSPHGFRNIPTRQQPRQIVMRNTSLPGSDRQMTPNHCLSLYLHALHMHLHTQQ